MFKKYFLNFWIWWYGIQSMNVVRLVYSFWNLSLTSLNIIPMISHLFVPMFQEQSLIGKFMSLLLRLSWVIFGSIILFLITIPLVVVLIMWLLLPFVCLLQIVRFLL